MDEHKAIPQAPEDHVWVQQRLAEVTAFFTVCIEASDDDRDVDLTSASLAFCQVKMQTLSRQGVAAWKQYTAEALTVMTGGELDDAGYGASNAELRARRNLYHSLTVSMRAIQNGLQRDRD